MIEKILVAVDGSQPARKGLDWAIGIAKFFDANLTILHVLSNRSLSEGERELVESEYQVQIGEALRGSAARKSTTGSDLLGSSAGVSVAVRTAMGRAMLSRAKVTANSRGVSSVKTLLTDGDPTSTILEQVNKEGFDLVVLGSRGLGRVKRIVRGSISYKLSQLSKCSVLLVK